MENNLKSGKRFMTDNGNMAVNFHNTFFFMDRFGNYIPWTLTLRHGKLLPQQEWVRLRNLAGGADVVKELTPFLNKKAAAIAEHLKNDAYYKMSEDQKKEAVQNRQNYLNAQAEGIDVDEYLRREEIRKQREEKRQKKEISITPAKVIPIKMNNGRASFFIGTLPGFAKLKEKFN